MDFIVILFGLATFWGLCGLVAGAMLESRGHSLLGGCVLGFLFGPLGIIIAAVTPPTQTQTLKQESDSNFARLMSGELKKCPYCAELVKSAAVVCRYCGKDIPAVAATPERTLFNKYDLQVTNRRIVVSGTSYPLAMTQKAQVFRKGRDYIMNLVLKDGRERSVFYSDKPERFLEVADSIQQAVIAFAAEAAQISSSNQMSPTIEGIDEVSLPAPLPTSRKSRHRVIGALLLLAAIVLVGGLGALWAVSQQDYSGRKLPGASGVSLLQTAEPTRPAVLPPTWTATVEEPTMTIVPATWTPLALNLPPPRPTAIDVVRCGANYSIVERIGYADPALPKDYMYGAVSATIVDPQGHVLRTFAGNPPDDPRRFTFKCGNLIGLGTTELMITAYTGGAHCCWVFDILEMTKGLPILLHWDAGDGGIGQFVQLTGKPPYQIMGGDARFDYFDSLGHAYSPYLPIVLALQDGEYVPATRQFPQVLRDDRTQAYQKLAQCNGDFVDLCSEEYALEIYADGVWLNDEAATLASLKAKVSPVVADWLDSNRAAVLQILAK